jgi:nuclear migration protein JNM1
MRRLEKESTGKNQGQSNELAMEANAASLSKMLDNISENYRNRGGKPGAALAQALKTTLKSSVPLSNIVTPSMEDRGATYTVTYSPQYQQSHGLAKVADFDARLTFLEKILGISSTAIPILDAKGIPITVLPALDRLHRQVSVLAESSPSSLDSMSRRLRALIQDTEKLEEVRRSAKAAHGELRAAGEEAAGNAGAGNGVDDSEQESKINALYGTLTTIENLSPLLPALLDRLRSLRAIHTDAAAASQNLERLAKRQEGMATDIKTWREGLGKVEEAIKQNETVIGANMNAVEGWVKDLEEKMAKLTS